MTKNLVSEFFEELSGQELRSPVYDSSMIIQGSGWNTSKYYSKYYKDNHPSPLLLCVKENDGLVYLSFTKEKNLVREVFRDYWKNSGIISEKEKEFERLGKISDKFYKKFSYKYFKTRRFSDCKNTILQFEENLWNLNALVFFSIYFDKDICRELIHELGIPISDNKLDMLWGQAIVPTSISFEKRRHLYLLQQIIDKKTWEEISENCQYFLTTYARIGELRDVKNYLYKEYTNVTKELAQEVIKKEKNSLLKKKEVYDKWMNTLSEDEQKLVTFLQFVIRFRDERKDFLMKGSTILFRLAEKLFEEANIDKKMIFFWSPEEVDKGLGYLIMNKELLQKRKKDGYCLLIHTNGTRSEEYGTFDKNIKRLSSYHKQQNTFTNMISSTVIKGQTGSRGKITGVVKIINNYKYEKDKLQRGEILVTGMTRPEFVPLMKIASGVITDEGGITCHAAIVSRELKIPCVIGTKIATKVLRDGDLVEVDANKGVIKIIR